MKRIISVLATMALLIGGVAIVAAATVPVAVINNPQLTSVNRNPDPESESTVLFATMKFTVKTGGTLVITSSRRLCNVYLRNNGVDKVATITNNGKTHTYTVQAGTIELSLVDWTIGFTMPLVTIGNYEFYKGYLTAKIDTPKIVSHCKAGQKYKTVVSIKANTTGRLWITADGFSYARDVEAGKTYTIELFTNGTKRPAFKANGIRF